MEADLVDLVQGLPRALRQPGDAAPAGAHASTSSTSRARSATCKNHWRFVPRGEQRLRGRLLRRLRVPLGDPAEADRHRLPRGDAADRARLRAARRGALRRPRQRLKRQLQRRLDAPRPHPRRARARRSRAARPGCPAAVAVANQTSPSGFASDAPGPATPVTATASSASDAASAPSAMARATGSDTAPCAASMRLRHPEHRHLRRVGVADEAAVEDVRRAGDVGDRGADQPAGAALGGGDPPAAGAGRGEQRAGLRLGAHASHPCASAAEQRDHAAAIRPASTSSSMTPVGPLRRSAQRPARASRCRRAGTARRPPPSPARERARRRARRPQPARERHQRHPLADHLVDHDVGRVEVVAARRSRPGSPSSRARRRAARRREQREAAQPVQQVAGRQRRQRPPGAGGDRHEADVAEGGDGRGSWRTSVAVASAAMPSPRPVKPRPLRGRRLDADPVRLDPGDARRAPRASRRRAGRSSAPRRPACSRGGVTAKPRAAARSTALRRKISEAAPCQARVRGREPLADVALGQRAEDRVGQRVHADVGVGMADQAAVERDGDAAEHHPVARAEGVHVEAVAGADVHRSLRRSASRPREVGGGGDLEVRLVARDHAHRKPGGAGHRGVVGRLAGVGAVGREDRGEAEALRGLRPPEALARRPAPSASAVLRRARGRRPPAGRGTRPAASSSASSTAAISRGRRERAGGVVDQHPVGRRRRPAPPARPAPSRRGSRRPATGGRRRGSPRPPSVAA